NTVLARRPLVQQNCRSSCPIRWNSKTGLPDRWAAAWASAKVECQRTRPGATGGLSSPVRGGVEADGRGIAGGPDGCEGACAETCRGVLIAKAATTEPVVSNTRDRNHAESIQHLMLVTNG